MLDKFVHGELDISPSNVAKLQRNLTAMAKLCEEKSDLREAYESIRDPAARAKAEERVNGAAFQGGCGVEGRRRG